MSSMFCYHCGRQLTREKGGDYVFVERRLFERGKPADQQCVVRLHVTDCARQFDEEQREERISARPRA